jgi:hypothetical protein
LRLAAPVRTRAAKFHPVSTAIGKVYVEIRSLAAPAKTAA